MSMNTLYEHAKRLNLVASDEEELDRSSFQILLVAPLGTVVPDDGILRYVTVDSFRDVLNAESGSVILFRQDQGAMLSVLSGNADALSVDVQALFGVPGAEYTRWFEEATFSRPRLSYGPLVSELRESANLNKIQEDNRVKTVSERETARRTRGDGTVRYHEDDSIGVAEPAEGPDSD